MNETEKFLCTHFISSSSGYGQLKNMIYDEWHLNGVP